MWTRALKRLALDFWNNYKIYHGDYLIPWILVQGLTVSTLSFHFLSLGCLVNELEDRKVSWSQSQRRQTWQQRWQAVSWVWRKQMKNDQKQALCLCDTGERRCSLYQGGREMGSFRKISTRNDWKFKNSLMLWGMTLFCRLALSLNR